MNSEKNSSPKKRKKSRCIRYHDEAVQPGLADLIENTVMDKFFDWHRPSHGFTSVKDTYPFDLVMGHDSRVMDSSQLVHSIFIEGERRSIHFHLVMELIKDITGNVWPDDDIQVQVGRAKINLLTIQNTPRPDCYNPPHIDPYLNKLDCIDVGDGFGQVNMLYYINNSDGDTFFFDGDHVTDYEHYAHRISPKKGRVVFFEPDQYHASSPPITNRHRLVLNVNLLTTRPLPELYKYIEEEET